jgi:hypothetical protein
MRSTPQCQHQHQDKSAQEHVSPPGRHATEPNKTSGLGGNAVCRHQLLLLIERIQKAKRMCAEADNSHDSKQHKRPASPSGNACALTPGRRGEHHERQHEPGRGLHADPDHEQGGCRAEVRRVHRNGGPPRARGEHAGFASRQRQRPGQDQQHERVVMRAAQGKLQQHRIQADEHGRHLRRASHLACRARRQGHRCEAARHGQPLESP